MFLTWELQGGDAVAAEFGVIVVGVVQGEGGVDQQPGGDDGDADQGEAQGTTLGGEGLDIRERDQDRREARDGGTDREDQHHPGAVVLYAGSPAHVLDRSAADHDPREYQVEPGAEVPGDECPDLGRQSDRQRDVGERTERGRDDQAWAGANLVP